MSDARMTAERTEAALAKVRGEIEAAEQEVSGILADGEVSEGEASRFATLRARLDLLRAREAALAADLPERRLAEADAEAARADNEWRETQQKLLARRAEVAAELRGRFVLNGAATFEQIVDSEVTVADLLAQVRALESRARLDLLRAATMRAEAHPTYRNGPPRSSTAARSAAQAAAGGAG